MKACPGSGKTYTAAARLHRLLDSWRQPHAGIATLSFTNVAWREIQEYLGNHFSVRVPLGYPHYLGTIDSFVNRFIFLPFGHHVMGCQSRPELRGPPHDDSEPIGSWLYWRNPECQRSLCRLNDFSYDDAGQLVHFAPQSHFNRCQSGHARCTKLKHQFAVSGYATQADANYYAMAILRDHPEIARAIARRFPTLIVDESQDTSRIQMRILEALIGAGLQEVMLVGDPYQAIYEWRHAEPQLFQDKFDAWRDNCLWLTENWRSTQSICDLACRLASSSERISAKNPQLAPFNHPPRLYGYDSESDLPVILEDFKTNCINLGIAPSSVSVLTRSRRFINDIIPGAVPDDTLVPWRDDDALTRQVAYAKYLLDRGDFKEAIRRLEHGVYRERTGDTRGRRDDVIRYCQSLGVGKWRGELFRLLAGLPPAEGKLSDWLLRASSIIVQCPLLSRAALAIKQDRQPNRYSELTFTDVFGGSHEAEGKQSGIIGTVHSAKGTSLEAVLLVLKSKGAAGKQYAKLLGSDLLTQEELRIVYVAVTRPRKALGIAVPKSALEHWRDFLFRTQHAG